MAARYRQFTNRRYSLECVFIIDPFYTFSMVIILYLSVRSKINKKKIAIFGLVWVFLYPMANLGIKYTLQNSIEGDHKKKRIVFERVHVLPEVFTPFFWKVIVENKTSYKIDGISLLDLKTPIIFTRYKKAEQSLFKRLGKYDSIFNTYPWFVDYPIMKTENYRQRYFYHLW